MDLLPVSLHEAGHCIAHLLAGVRVAEVWASADGGGCQAASQGRPSETIVAALAGSAAVELLHGPGANGEHLLSVADSKIVLAAEEKWCIERQVNPSDRQRRVWREQATTVVLNNELLIRTFAATLRQRGRLDEQALAAFCHAPRSIFGQFAVLYSRPAARSTEASLTFGGPDPNCPAARLPGARWSEQYRCYLTPSRV